MIELLNVKECEVFDHAIIYLFGNCCDFSQPNIDVIDHFGNSISWKIANNYFKVRDIVINWFI